MKDFVRRGRSNSSAELSSSSRSLTSPRMSILPSVRLPSLRRHEASEPPAHQKDPLLTLTLSSPSFLDSKVKDIYSSESLYQIKTIGTSTTVSRRDPKEPSVIAASIKWPRIVPLKTKGKEYSDGVLVLMKEGRWVGGESVLKPASNEGAPRKFNIPNYSQSMKWKRYGNTYWCITSSVKGPIATFTTAKGENPTTLTVFETLHDKYDPKSLSAFKGVSILLLDYLLVTALLLVTDLQDWMLVSKFEGKGLAIPNPTDPNGQGPSSAPDLPPATDPQWRKIMYGEPIFPKLSGEALSRLSTTSSPMSSTTPGLPRTPTSAGVGGPTYSYVEGSEASSSRPSSRKMAIPSMVDDDADCASISEEEVESYELSSTRPSSPSAESVHFSSLAPSHTYIDPTFYGSQSRPPVPPHPLQYANSFNGRNFSSQPSTPISPTLRTTRGLPQPPISQSIPRPRSSPPLKSPHHADSDTEYMTVPPHLQVEISRRPSTSSGISNSNRSSTSYTSPPTSVRRRPLPRPPQVPPVNNSPAHVPHVPRRVQSTNQLLTKNSYAREAPPRPQRSLPPTPHDGHMMVPSPIASPLVEEDDLQLLANDLAITQTPVEFDAQARVTSPASALPQHLHPETAQAHSRRPPITKASQEDLTEWVHMLTSPQRDLPAAPLPGSSIFDVPPPAYSSINFSRRDAAVQRPPVPATYPKVGSDLGSGPSR